MSLEKEVFPFMAQDGELFPSSLCLVLLILRSLKLTAIFTSPSLTRKNNVSKFVMKMDTTLPQTNDTRDSYGLIIQRDRTTFWSTSF